MMDPALRAYVFARDGGCVARFASNRLEGMRWPIFATLPDPGLCRNQWGDIIDPHDLRWCHADHRKDEIGMGIREDDPNQIWCVCGYHHMGKMGSGWATRSDVAAVARVYIPAANAMAAERGWPTVPALA